MPMRPIPSKVAPADLTPVAEAAKQLGVSRGTVTYRIARGELSSVKIGNRLYVYRLRLPKATP